MKSVILSATVYYFEQTALKKFKSVCDIDNLYSSVWEFVAVNVVVVVLFMSQMKID